MVSVTEQPLLLSMRFDSVVPMHDGPKTHNLHFEAGAIVSFHQFEDLKHLVGKRLVFQCIEVKEEDDASRISD